MCRAHAWMMTAFFWYLRRRSLALMQLLTPNRRVQYLFQRGSENEFTQIFRHLVELAGRGFSAVGSQGVSLLVSPGHFSWLLGVFG